MTRFFGLRGCLTGVLVGVLVLIAPSAFAQDWDEEEDWDEVAEDLPSTEEVVVTAERSPVSLSRSPRAVSIVTGEEILSRMSRTVPEALRYETGVLIQRTNLGGGAPFIRGLAGNQLLYLVDGIRVNNSTFRGGPNQYLNTIDPMFIDRIEVVRGPGSVLYGSDALGGTINVITKRRKDYSEPFGADGRIMGRFGTADGEETVHFGADFNFGKAFGGAFSANHRKFGDVDPGGSLGVQSPYGYQEQDFAGNADLHFGEKVTWSFSAQHVNLDEVPNYDPANPKNEFDPQTRDLYYTRLVIEDMGVGLDRVDAFASYHRQFEGREKIRALSPRFQTRDEDLVETIGGGLQLESPIGEWLRFIYGAELYQDRVRSKREEKYLVTGQTFELDPQFPDDSTFRSMAGYLEMRLTPVDWLKLVPGIRYSSFTPDIELEDPRLGTVRVDDEIADFSWAFHSLFAPADHQALILGVSRGFRVPSIDDLAKLGREDGRYDIPNSDLDPESLIQYEAGYRLTHPRARLSLFAYYSKIQDLITRKPATYGGEEYIGDDRVHRNENVGEAHIYGWEFATDLELVEDFFSLGGTAFYTFGQNDSDDEPMRRIPPLSGTARARLDIEPAWIEVASEHAATQDRLSQADKDDSRIGENGTRGFSVYNFSLGVTVHDWLEIITALENAFDRQYKVHGSGLYETGRNFKTQVSLKF